MRRARGRDRSGFALEIAHRAGIGNEWTQWVQVASVELPRRVNEIQGLTRCIGRARGW